MSEEVPGLSPRQNVSDVFDAFFNFVVIFLLQYLNHTFFTCLVFGLDLLTVANILGTFKLTTKGLHYNSYFMQRPTLKNYSVRQITL